MVDLKIGCRYYWPYGRIDTMVIVWALKSDEALVEGIELGEIQWVPRDELRPLRDTA